MRILVAEDDGTTALFLKSMLSKAGHDVVVARDGASAERALGQDTFDMLVTDWMMPEVDGIELIHRARKQQLVPLAVMVTQICSPNARLRALESGADAFITKPISPPLLFETIDDCMKRHQQPTPIAVCAAAEPTCKRKPPFVGVALAASTGGPDQLRQFFARFPTIHDAAYFVVLHGPAWLMEAVGDQLQAETNLKVHLAEHGEEIRAGHVYIAPGDQHLRVTADFQLALSQGPRENFCRPSADPLFRSVGDMFGAHSIAVVFTGMGKDGCFGAKRIAKVGVEVVVQDPTTAVASSMPAAVISAGIVSAGVEPHRMPGKVLRGIQRMTPSLLSGSC